jgi:hypothetical protein
MMKTICICDRCKKEFPAKKAKRIIFESSLPEKENAGSKIVDMIMTLFPLPVSDGFKTDTEGGSRSGGGWGWWSRSAGIGSGSVRPMKAIAKYLGSKWSLSDEF